MTTYWAGDRPPQPRLPAGDRVVVPLARQRPGHRDQVTRREAYEDTYPYVRIRCIGGWWRAWPPGRKPLTCATLGGLLDALGAE